MRHIKLFENFQEEKSEIKDYFDIVEDFGYTVESYTVKNDKLNITIKTDRFTKTDYDIVSYDDKYVKKAYT